MSPQSTNESLPLTEVRRESSAGYHFMTEYRDCPRKWFLHYMLGFQPRYTAPPLLFGRLWHEVLEFWYHSQNVGEALSYGGTVFDEIEHEYKYKEDFQKDKEKFPGLLQAWVTKIGQKQVKAYEILELEVPCEGVLPNGMRMTGRLDGVARNRISDSVVILEHKTTGYSLSKMAESVEAEDQVTCYAWLLKQARPELFADYFATELDVSYHRGANYAAEGTLISRNSTDLAQFALGAAGTFNELTQKALAWRDHGAPEAMLFPRYGRTCGKFPCEYASICRRAISASDDLSPSFVQEPWIDTTGILLNKGVFDAEEKA